MAKVEASVTIEDSCVRLRVRFDGATATTAALAEAMRQRTDEFGARIVSTAPGAVHAEIPR